MAGLGELTPNETVAVDQAAGGVHQRFFVRLLLEWLVGGTDISFDSKNIWIARHLDN